MQLFQAPKVLVVTGSSEKDSENEIRAVMKLCNGEHPNIIKVLRRGQLPPPNSDRYYFDMELCQWNLEIGIQRLWQPSDKSREFSDPNFGPSVPVDRASKMKYVWSIMRQIADGVTFKLIICTITIGTPPWFPGLI
jgi:hypothetical protein